MIICGTRLNYQYQRITVATVDSNGQSGNCDTITDGHILHVTSVPRQCKRKCGQSIYVLHLLASGGCFYFVVFLLFWTLVLGSRTSYLERAKIKLPNTMAI